MLRSFLKIFLLFGIIDYSLQLSNDSTTETVSLRLIGGQPIQVEQVPYFASIESYYGNPFCGGSIISARYVLTAGHCVYYKSSSALRVRVGSGSRSTGGTVMSIRNIFIHPGYYEEPSRTQSPKNDIAIIELNYPIAFGYAQQPIRMFNAGERCPVGSYAQVSGIGKDGYNRRQGQLKSVMVPVIDTRMCYYKYQGLTTGLREGQICTEVYGSNIGPWVGDSGGPMVVGGRLAGIASFTIKVQMYKLPSVYTDVAYHRNWIRSVTGL